MRTTHDRCNVRRAVCVPLLLVASASCFDADDTREPLRSVRHVLRTRIVGSEHERVARPTPHVRADSVLDAAEALLHGGRPWRATELLAPVLRNPSTRTSRTVLVAARAASAWRGWDEVVRLLARERWLDSAYNGEGHALLARAALETNRRDHDSLALDHARRAVAATSDSATRARRLVVLAQTLARVGLADSARAVWVTAARSAPPIADWLLLQAARLTSSAAERRALHAQLSTDVAIRQMPWVEADARERAGDLAGAAWLLDSLGAKVQAMRLRLSMTRRSADRASFRRQLNAIVAAHGGAASVRQAIALLDRAFAPLTAQEQLAIARAAATVGPAARAAAGFAAAFDAGVGTAADRYAYGKVLAALGRHDKALPQFTRAMRSPPYAGRARYQHARSLLRAGRLAESRTELRSIVRGNFDPSSSASALFLLADLATDEGRDSAAREAFVELVRRFPTSTLAPRAALRAAIITFVHESASRAAREFDALRTRYPASSEAVAATYWAGRAWQKAANSTRARDRWRRVLERDPNGYYAMLARARTHAPRPVLTSGEPVPFDASIDSAMARAALLEQLGLRAEARHEYDYLERRARRSSDAALRAARAFVAHQNGGRAIRLAAEARRRIDRADGELFRLLYPLPYKETILFESSAHGIEPALVAALIRQESSFTPSATSAVGARGLMQIMPAVGRQSAIARSAGVWSDALLYQPDVSLRLGSAHLASLLSRYRDPARALAAYNAGESRVERWSRKPGTSDAEIFVERIPYVETRDYVRIVLRNMTWYRRLYEL
jgi:soluble lytic murein transglycosylase